MVTDGASAMECFVGLVIFERLKYYNAASVLLNFIFMATF